MRFSTSQMIVENSLMSMPDEHDGAEVWRWVRDRMRESGWTQQAMSRHLGYCDLYVRGAMQRHSVPRLDTFADIAAACGYELVLRRKRGAR